MAMLLNQSTFARRIARLLIAFMVIWNILPHDVALAHDDPGHQVSSITPSVCGTFPFTLRHIEQWDNFSLSHFTFDLPAGRYSIGVSGHSMDLFAGYMVASEDKLRTSPFKLNGKESTPDEAPVFTTPWVYYEESPFPLSDSAVDIVETRQQTALYFAADRNFGAVDSFNVTITCLDGKQHPAPATRLPELESSIPTATLLPAGSCQPNGYFSNMTITIKNDTAAPVEYIYIAKDGGSSGPLYWYDWVRSNDRHSIGVPVGEYYFYTGCSIDQAKALFKQQTGLTSIELGR